MIRSIMPDSIALHLLDSTQSHPLQVWSFDNVDSIQLGRSSQNDVQISHPYVSRHHATIMFLDEEWGLHVLSQNGAFVEGKKVSYAKLAEGTVFQLAAGGPCLKFNLCESEPNISSKKTDSFELDPASILHLDASQRDREVEEIVTSPYFAELQKKITRLRNRKP